MFALTLFIANLTLLIIQTDKSKWELSLEKDDISVYTRNSDGTKFREFLAETTMNGSIENFKSIISDINKYPDWLPDCQSAVIIERLGEYDITYHLKLKVPFPFENRDIVQQLVLKGNRDHLKVNIINRPNLLQKEKKFVRMSMAHGSWDIQEIPGNKISIKFQYLADPGGEIPVWLVNSFVVKNPHRSLVNIRKLLADYQG